jgi:Fic family protein
MLKLWVDGIQPERVDAPAILKKLVAAHRHLAELKGVAASIPNQGILISTLGLQEAKESSAIDNIVTSHDQLFRGDAPDSTGGAAAKKVRLYSQAQQAGFAAVRQNGLLTSNHILDIHAVLEPNRAGYRKVPGTTLKDGAGRNLYTPPSPELLPGLMQGLEKFINDASTFDADPLVKMALIHQQFESIQPFDDGNGRTGRIMNALYLVKENLLDIPVLTLSRAIVRTKSDYHARLQAVRDHDAWEEWILYMLTAVEQTAAEVITTIESIRDLLLDYKHRIRARHKFYSQDLITTLFSFPYTKIEFVQSDLKVSRLTATRYLDELAKDGLLRKRKSGRSNYYINDPLFRILTGETPPTGDDQW